MSLIAMVMSTIPNVNIPPVASFTKSVSTGTIPLTVNFTDTSSNLPTSWLWDFGDGSTSTLKNPSHQYSTSGTFNVTLTATNIAGSNTTASQAIIANDPPISGNVQTVTISPAFGLTDPLKAVAYGNNMFVALLNNQTAPQGIIYSSDAINWSAKVPLYPVGNSTRMQCLNFGNGNFIMGHTNDYKTYNSADGINWTMNYVASTIGLATKSIKGANGVYIHCGSTTTYSTDMVNWTVATNPNSIQTVEYLPSAGKWVTQIPSSTVTRYSTNNGATWVNGPTLAVAAATSAFSASDGRIALFPANLAGGQSAYTDGTTWNTYTAPFRTGGICYGGGKFVAVGYNDSLVYSSTDGINWSQVATIPVAAGNYIPSGITYGNGKYVITPMIGATNKIFIVT